MIRSGVLGDPSVVRDYRAEKLGSMLVERVVWGEETQPVRSHGVVVAEGGWIWFRFWLVESQQVVERYYGERGELVGTHVDLCMPFDSRDGEYATVDLLLDIWIDPTGRVTVHDEARFESAAELGVLSAEEVKYAERHLRALTAAIAQHQFPPAIVRNWQVDVRRSGLEGEIPG